MPGLDRIQEGGADTIKIGEFRVRNPETAKEAIKELSFTQSEELLFKRLGFDKPFIRKYITKPDASPEESNASKQAFFDFWKLYVLMDGTSQFSLMTKKESQEVQGYMREILDAYRSYLSESALKLLFHTTGKPYEHVSEESTDSFVFTKTISTNHTKVSTAVKILIEAVNAAKEIDFKADRLSIVRASTPTSATRAYEFLNANISRLVIEAKKAINAAKDASIKTTDEELKSLEAFKFTPGNDQEDIIKAGNDLISLANKLVKNLETLRDAAEKFAIIREVEDDDDDDNSYESSDNGEDEDEDEDEEDEDEEDEEEDSSNAATLNSLENVRRPREPSNEITVELKKLLSKIDTIVSKKVDDNKAILDIINELTTALPDDFGVKLRKFMGTPPKGNAIHIDVGTTKIMVGTFFNLYLIEKGRSSSEPTKRFSALIHNLIKLYTIPPNDNIKPVLHKFFKEKILLREITGRPGSLLTFIETNKTKT